MILPPLLVRALAGYQRGKDPGCEVIDRSRHRALKSQEKEAFGKRGVPIVVPVKERLEAAVGPSVTFVAVWKAKRSYLVGR